MLGQPPGDPYPPSPEPPAIQPLPCLHPQAWSPQCSDIGTAAVLRVPSAPHPAFSPLPKRSGRHGLGFTGGGGVVRRCSAEAVVGSGRIQMGSEGTDCHLGYSLSSAGSRTKAPGGIPDWGGHWEPPDKALSPRPSLAQAALTMYLVEASIRPKILRTGQAVLPLEQLGTCHWAAWWRGVQMVVTGGRGHSCRAGGGGALRDRVSFGGGSAS